MSEADLGLDDEQAARAAAMFDPAWEERQRRQAEALPSAMGRAMATLEPTVRTALSELYAVHFSEGELTDIAAFFATDSGGAFARKSYVLASDPRLMASVSSEMPAVMGGLMSMQQLLDDATADLPKPRTFADLSSNERKRLADMLGLAIEDLDYSAQWGSDAEEADAAVDATATAVDAAIAAAKVM